MSEGKQIDWSIAPDGATHWQPYQRAFYSLDGEGKWRVWGRNLSGMLCWSESPGTCEAYLIERETEDCAWSGTGLPPDGCEIEYHSPSRGWVRGEYIGQFNGQMVVGCRETSVIGYCPADIVRPIRTPEQIAAEERQKAIDEMWGYLRTDEYEEVRIQRRACADLYDAGYRKAKGES